MRKILIIGFGAMGCRHVQSLLNHKEEYDMHVVEPSHENIRINLEKIGASPQQITFHPGLENVTDDFDLAIVATSSAPRFGIVQQLLQKGIKLFLLEKIVFQSEYQFEAIIQMMYKFKAKAYCNFVNRYFDTYNAIKGNISEAPSPCTMFVHGGEFGLGCNAIHYLDIFQYINGIRDLTMEDYQLHLVESENRRGNAYREFSGAIDIRDSSGNRIVIISEKNFSGGITINIQLDQRQYLLSEQTQQAFFISHQDVSVSDFTILPTSKLSHTIVQDIFSGICRLTQVGETAAAHALLFDCFNKTIYNSIDENTLCPIT